MNNLRKINDIRCLPEETRLKISESNKETWKNPELRKVISELHKGIPHKEEHRRKIGEANRRRIWKEESKKKISERFKGKSLPEEHVRKLSGENNYNWNSDSLYRSGVEFRKHPKPCEVCGTTLNLVMHHKDGNHKNNTLENIMWLCRKHHLYFHDTCIKGLTKIHDNRKIVSLVKQ
jgi:hypothetical protein